MRLAVMCTLGPFLVSACNLDAVQPIREPEQPVPGSATTCGFEERSFAFPSDNLSCDGPQHVRFDEEIGLFVGVVSCAPDEVRVYLSRSASGPFVQAADTGGHGQDHCALVNPTFTIENDDDITSGGCASCAAGAGIPLEGVPVFSRANIDQQFVFVPRTPEWSHQAARLRCGIDVSTCALDPPHEPPGPPAPQGDVACSAGATVTMSWAISGWDMDRGAGDTGGAGLCTGRVTFADDLSDLQASIMAVPDTTSYITGVRVEYNGTTSRPGCGSDPHCGTLRHSGGRTEERMCTVLALCDATTGRASSVGFAW